MNLVARLCNYTVDSTKKIELVLKFVIYLPNKNDRTQSKNVPNFKLC